MKPSVPGRPPDSATALPEMIRLSYGTAIELGLVEARQEVAPTTGYLLWDPGCRGTCSFCPRAGGNTREKHLSRITWPEFPLQEILRRLGGGANRGVPTPTPSLERGTLSSGRRSAPGEGPREICHEDLPRGEAPPASSSPAGGPPTTLAEPSAQPELSPARGQPATLAGELSPARGQPATLAGELSPARGALRRICLQTGWNPDAEEELAILADALLACGIPLSATLHPAQCKAAGRLLARGLDHIGIGLDAATPATYRRHKNRDWSEDWPPVMDLIRTHPGRIEIHLIFGLGDTEAEFVQTVSTVLAAGGEVSLFALTPVGKGSPPDLGAYRRMQVFRHLTRLGRDRTGGMLRLPEPRFADGRLVSMGFSTNELGALLADGEAFRTSGCPDCNRPFYNERPGGPMYNFPRPLTLEEARVALHATGWLSEA